MMEEHIAPHGAEIQPEPITEKTPTNPEKSKFALIVENSVNLAKATGEIAELLLRRAPSDKELTHEEKIKIAQEADAIAGKYELDDLACDNIGDRIDLIFYHNEMIYRVIHETQTSKKWRGWS